MHLQNALTMLPHPPSYFINEKNTRCNLPEEILKYIFELCLIDQDLKQAQTLALTCKKFYRIIMDFEFIYFIQFLSTLSHINKWNASICIHPNLFKKIDKCRLEVLPIKQWAHFDQTRMQGKGIKNLLRIDFEQLVLHSQNLSNKEDQSQISPLEGNLQDESNKLRDLYRLIKEILKYSPWKFDLAHGSLSTPANQMPARYVECLKRIIPDQKIRNWILRCKIQATRLAYLQMVKTIDMDHVLSLGILGKATTDNKKEIHQIIFESLSKSSIAYKAKNCEYDTAFQLIENTDKADDLEILLGYLDTTPLFKDLSSIQSLCLKALRKNPLILRKVFQFVSLFPKDKQYAFKRVCALTALKINPNIEQFFKDLFTEELQNDEWIMYEKNPQLWKEKYL